MPVTPTFQPSLHSTTTANKLLASMYKLKESSLSFSITYPAKRPTPFSNFPNQKLHFLILSLIHLCSSLKTGSSNSTCYLEQSLPL